jgi:hypothetical protein
VAPLSIPFSFDSRVSVKLLSVGVSILIVASVPETATFSPLVKFKEAASVISAVPSSFTISSGVAVAFTVELASITTPFNSRFVPSNNTYLLAFPNTILPPVRFRNAPLSLPVGAEFASGIFPPFSVPAVISPMFAVIAERLVVLISVAVTALAFIRVETIEFAVTLSAVIAFAASLSVVIALAAIASAVISPATM